jgi:hypothetical protein
MTVGKWTAGAIERFEDWTASVELVDYHQDEESVGIYFIDRRPPLQQLVSGSSAADELAESLRRGRGTL